MEKKKLGEVFEFIRNGASIKQIDSASGYPITRIETIANGFIDNDRMGYADITELDKYQNYVLEYGDILMSHINSEKHLGKSAIFLENDNIVIHGMNLLGLRCNKDILFPKYAHYYFNSDRFRRQIPKITKKSVNQASFSVSDVRDLDILVPKLESQLKISNILDKAQELIDKRKEQIEACDELIKGLFYDMFGDVVVNNKKWNKDRIGNNFNIKTGATPSRKENLYWESGNIPWVKTTELKENVILNTDEYITQIAYENSSVSLFPKDTVLIAMYGQGKTRGMTGKLGIEATSNQACAAILPNNNYNQDFIWIQLRLLYDELRSLGRGGNQPNLNLDLVRDFELILPPLDLQNQFAQKVQKIEQQKLLMQQSLTELENNFNSLMQRAFKGELF